MDDTLFELPPTEPDEHEEAAGVPRLQVPSRGQLELRSVDLDGLLGPDHRARLVWAFVESLDLGPLYARIKAIEGRPGRPPIDPAILVALWLYATLEGIGSARALDRLCAEHDAYRWLGGGVGLNHHTLAAFRVEHADVLDQLLTESVAALLADGLANHPSVHLVHARKFHRGLTGVFECDQSRQRRLGAGAGSAHGMLGLAQPV
jgi:transposase